jgi:hypothetical protein
MKPIKSNRFICTEISGGGFDATQSRVLVDRKTGVNYLWTAAGYAGGLTVLVDAEGKPIVTPVPADNEDED